MRCDYLSFKDLLQDLCEKAGNLKIMVTCKTGLIQVHGFEVNTYVLQRLHNNVVFELLALKASSQKAHMSEMKELADSIEKTSDSPGKNNEIIDHPLFKILNGHPLSIHLLSALRTGELNCIIIL